jgi:hypothetical protein
MAGRWLAQRDGLPDNYKQYVDAGSTLEAVYLSLGYVEVDAPGTEDDEPAPEQESTANAGDAEWAAIAASDADDPGGDSTSDR